MKVFAINGSPRRRWNTATLLEKALEGAASRGAETDFVHLYEMEFKGCDRRLAPNHRQNVVDTECRILNSIARLWRATSPQRSLGRGVVVFPAK